MAKLKNPLLSLGAVGNVTKAITFLRRRKTNIAEEYPIPKDAKSLAQMSWRHMYQKAIALWNALSATEKQEWESLARPKHMTGYAWFISQALKPNPGLYLPLQGGTMSGDIDMAKHLITRLPAPTDDQHPVTKKYFEDNLPVGGYTEGARVYHSANQAIPHATWTALAFDSERWDTDTIHDLVINNGRLTCKTAGKYLIMAYAVWHANATGWRAVRFYFNGAAKEAANVLNLGATEWPKFTPGVIWNLAVNDYVELYANQNSGGALNFSSESFFMMQRIG